MQLMPLRSCSMNPRPPIKALEGKLRGEDTGSLRLSDTFMGFVLGGSTKRAVRQGTSQLLRMSLFSASGKRVRFLRRRSHGYQCRHGIILDGLQSH
jgi:hypothetical protein